MNTFQKTLFLFFPTLIAMEQHTPQPYLPYFQFPILIAENPFESCFSVRVTGSANSCVGSCSKSPGHYVLKFVFSVLVTVDAEYCHQDTTSQSLLADY